MDSRWHMDAEFQVSLLAMSKLPGVGAFVSRLQAYRACPCTRRAMKNREARFARERRHEKAGIVL